MRSALLLPPSLLAAALLLGAGPRPVEAKPEFARREGKACGYCHINPRGGGPRNERGLAYARNGFTFPRRDADLTDFERDKDREAYVEARRLIDLQHISAAIDALRRLERGVRGDRAKALVEASLHELDVQGTEVLGRARVLLLDGKPNEAIELLAQLVLEFDGLPVHDQAEADLRELKKQREYRDVVRAEEREARAWIDYLDAQVARARGETERARALLEKVVARHEGTRAARLAASELEPPAPEAAEPPADEGSE